MRLVQLIARLNDAGPARVVEMLCSAAATAGWEVLLLHGRTPAEEADATPALVGRRGEHGVACRELADLGPQLDAAADRRAWRTIVAELRGFQPDLVHTHTAKAGVLGRLAAYRLGVAVLHTYHGHVLHGYFGTGRSAAYRLIERLLGWRSHLHTLGPTLHRELAVGYGIGRPGRWHVLPVPVARPAPVPSVPAWPLEPGVPVLGFLGRLAPVKDPYLWLASLRALRQRRPVQGLVCGSGPELEPARRLARRWGLPVHFAGHVPTAQALAAMDCLLLSSRNEGQPLAAIEAASCGLPVVAPAVGGCHDLADRGIVVSTARRPAALAAACERALLTTDATAPAARRRAAAAFAPERLLPAYLALYAALAAGRSARSQPDVSGSDAG